MYVCFFVNLVLLSKKKEKYDYKKFGFGEHKDNQLLKVRERVNDELGQKLFEISRGEVSLSCCQSSFWTQTREFKFREDWSFRHSGICWIFLLINVFILCLGSILVERSMFVFFLCFQETSAN